jgi:hypothetical protein
VVGVTEAGRGVPRVHAGPRGNRGRRLAVGEWRLRATAWSGGATVASPSVGAWTTGGSSRPLKASGAGDSEIADSTVPPVGLR